MVGGGGWVCGVLHGDRGCWGVWLCVDRFQWVSMGVDGC